MCASSNPLHRSVASRSGAFSRAFIKGEGTCKGCDVRCETIYDCFRNEMAACTFLETHIWSGGISCPHCGGSSRLGRLNGLSTILGTIKCYDCRKLFTVRANTIFEHSHVPLHVWMQATYLLVGSGLRIGAPKLSQVLGISIRTAWQLKRKVLNAIRDELSVADVEAASRHTLASPLQRSLPLAALKLPGDEDAARPLPGEHMIEARFQRFLAAVNTFTDGMTDQKFFLALTALVRAHRAEQNASTAVGTREIDELPTIESAC